MSEFIKLDNGKLEYDLFEPKEYKKLIEILTFGKNKYGKGNWKKCDDKMRYYNALIRHLEKWRMGEKIDDESGKEHLAHVLTNAYFLLYLDNEE